MRREATMDVNEKTVLVIDDKEQSLKAVSTAIELPGYRVLSAGDGAEGIRILQRDTVHLIVTDLKMPGMDGMDVVTAAKRKDPNIEVIVMTAYGSIGSAVEAMKKGAYDYLTKPLDLDELMLKVRGALEKQKLMLRVEDLEQQLDERYGFENIVGTSDKMRRVYELVRQVAPSSSTVLITGESGAGKELVARAIHRNSPRRNGPFVPLNCSAVPEGLLESELFGHEKGAFTGATERHRGVFEAADGGTLLLDEIVEMSPATQVNILRVLEDREFTRVGGRERISTDIRVIAATNVSLDQAVAESRFRPDLYYRLKVISIEVPPLRERREDVPLLAARFVQQFSRENDKQIRSIGREALDALMEYDWPGNVRELRNCIESVVVMSDGDSIRLEDLPPGIRGSGSGERRLELRVGTPMEEIEREFIKETLCRAGGNQTRAAEMLKISVRTLQRKIKRYGMS